MKPLLAIETATEIGSVAVGTPDEVRAEVVLETRRQASHLVPAIQEALDAAAITYGDLAGVVVGDGPGSFTGLRIGFATAQGILRASPHLDLWTVPSLLSAAAVGGRFGFGRVAALYDALRGEVFAAVCRTSGRALEVQDGPRLTTPENLMEGPLRPDIAVGDGAWNRGDLMRRWTGRAPLSPTVAGPRASALVELVGIPAVAARIEYPFAFEPEYGRKAEAQVKWERRHGRPLPDSGGTRG